VTTCIHKGVLENYLTEQYKEVIAMFNYEYDAEVEKRVLRQEGREEGMDIIVSFLREGLTIEEAYIKAQKALTETQ